MKHTGSHTITIDSFDDIFCSFISIGDRLECSKCGNKIKVVDNIDEIPKLPCRSPLIGNNIPNSIHTFANAAIEDNNLCSLSTIEQRHNICNSCEYYQNNSCSQCGCAIIRDRNYLNKIAIKTERCPMGLWTESDS